MQTIKVITFKGCQTAIDFTQQLTALNKQINLDAEINTIVVPSPEKAEEMGLYGSPTILINDEEYQKQPFATPGFY